MIPSAVSSPVDEDQPFWDVAGRIYFRAAEGRSNFLYRMKGDGSERIKLLPNPILVLYAVSPDGRCVVIGEGLGQDPDMRMAAVPLGGEPAITICPKYCEPQWNAGGSIFSVSVEVMEGTKTVQIPLLPGKNLPALPAAGIQSREDMARLRGAKVLDGRVTSGPTSELSVTVRQSVHRNLYRVHLQ